MKIIVWLFRAALFFVLLAFALNNQHEATIKWFFGQEWHSPMVFVVLAAFTLGCAFGVLAMVPSWWQHRRAAARKQRDADPLDEAPEPPRPDPSLPSDAKLLQHEL